MCEENAVDKLMDFDFAGIASEVEAALAFKARNADPRLQPSYSRILYTWYTRRGDYRNGMNHFLSLIFLLRLFIASLTMYQRARKLRDLITDNRSFIALAEDQLESLSVAINALYLVDEKSAWILMPVIPDPVCFSSFDCMSCLYTLNDSLDNVRNFRNMSQRPSIFQVNMMPKSSIWPIWNTIVLFFKLKST